MPASHPNAAVTAHPRLMPSSASRCTQETTLAYALSRDAAPEISIGKGRSIVQDTISGKAVGRPRCVRIAIQRSSRYFPGRRVSS